MDFTTTLTPLEIAGNALQLLLLVVLPVVLVVKNWDTVLQRIKTLFNTIQVWAPKAFEFILPVLKGFFSMMIDAAAESKVGSKSKDEEFNEKKPVVTHNETRWDYDPWLENK